MSPRAAAFLDRDGTLMHDFHYTSQPEDVVLLGDAARAVRRLNDAGVPAVVATNQSGIARGFFTLAESERVNDRLQELLVPYWLEHGSPTEVMPLTGDIRTRVAALLGTTADDAEHALERWAGEQNLERRVAPGGVDRIVLRALEDGRTAVDAAIARSLPVSGWPE